MSSRAFIALGSNLGHRYGNISAALRHLRGIVGRVSQTSLLYETPPMHYTDQPAFLNAVCEVHTDLKPLDLLHKLKSLEELLGRQKSFVNGPRIIDLDILMYDDQIVSVGDTLHIPHPRIAQRAFVLKPFVDFAPNIEHSVLRARVADLASLVPKSDLDEVKRVLPLVRRHDGAPEFLSLERPLIAGILNVTPDSFSDGGKHFTLDDALRQAERLMADGADIIDVGGESTRPGAMPVSVGDEILRVVPVIRGMRARGFPCAISIDTRSAAVAHEAILAGADIINDVSGGKHDPHMLTLAADCDAPIILTHMRGSPQTMQLPENSTYSTGVVHEVSNELQAICEGADEAGIAKWNQIVDPGIGFAKNFEDILTLQRPDAIARLKDVTGSRTMMVGMSRKRFLMTLLKSNRLSDESIQDRDWATAGVCCSLAASGVDILRVHEVRGVNAALIAFQAVR